MLQVGVEKGRHLSSLKVAAGYSVCIKIHLMAGYSAVSNDATGGTSTSGVDGSRLTWCTHPETELDKPCFGESFAFPIHSWSRLRSNTLQLSVWSTQHQHEAQVVSVRWGEERQVMYSISLYMLLLIYYYHHKCKFFGYMDLLF